MKACILDVDGTLTDTLDSLTYSVNETLKEMKLTPITSDECRNFVGNGARVLMEKSLGAAGEADGSRLDEAMEIYGRIFDANCTYLVKPYEGVEEMLAELKRRGTRLAVLSNKPHRQTVKVVEEIFGGEVFDCVQGQQEKIARKPDPEGIYCLLEALQADREECLYVGDSEVDIRTGKNAGVRTVGVAWGFRTREVLEDEGAETIIETPEELMEIR